MRLSMLSVRLIQVSRNEYHHYPIDIGSRLLFLSDLNYSPQVEKRNGNSSYIDTERYILLSHFTQVLAATVHNQWGPMALKLIWLVRVNSLLLRWPSVWSIPICQIRRSPSNFTTILVTLYFRLGAYLPTWFLQSVHYESIVSSVLGFWLPWCRIESVLSQLLSYVRGHSLASIPATNRGLRVLLDMGHTLLQFNRLVLTLRGWSPTLHTICV